MSICPGKKYRFNSKKIFAITLNEFSLTTDTFFKHCTVCSLYLFRFVSRIVKFVNIKSLFLVNISGSRARFIAVMSVNGKVADDSDEKATSGEIEERIEDFKQNKARQKSSFTRIKNKLLRMVDEQDYPSRREIKEMCQQLSDAQERAMETMTRLSIEYLLLKDREKRKKVVEEIDKLELEFSEANEKAKEYLDAPKDELSSQPTEVSENTRRHRITESVAKKAQNKFEGTKQSTKKSLITKSHHGD